MIPVVDFDLFVLDELPQSHQTLRFISWFQGIFRGSIKWLNKNFYNYCYGDSISGVWNSVTTYNLNDTVKTYFGTFISLVDSNVGNVTTNTNFWYKISPCYIGSYERAQYNSQKRVIEYALNRYFFTTYKNPTSITTGGYLPLSDIYIQTVNVVYPSLVSFTTSTNSSKSFTNSASGYSFTDFISLTDTTYKYIIYIPSALATLLGVNYDSIIRSKADTTNLAGTSYTIQTY